MNGSENAAIRRRTLLLGVFLCVVAIAYITAFVIAKAVVVFRQETFSSSTIGGALPLDVYLDVTAVDPIRQSIDMRLDVATGPGSNGTRYFGKLNRDVELRVSDGETEQDFRLRRDEPLSSAVFVAGLRGVVNRYPFDWYSTSTVVSAFELSSETTRKPIPVRVKVWEGVPAWLLSVTKVTPSDAALGLTLGFGVHRPGAVVFFGCVIYGLMVLIAVCALVIGSLTFVGIRRVEVTLVGALTAMMFALPILRNVLPGTPPLGVLGDILIFLWAEIAASVGLTLFITAWIQRGPRP